ncbi:MAG: bifunctional folylpolyglutamate synthase/dihydrofolate synthase [Lachnospiraceae bacterium]|nr:bifunctional folylpolyglutamate synthase/dihydrofolate synthase [Lachnospiraceae bacterium]
MTYKEAIEYTGRITKLGIVPGLTSISELLQRLGNPQERLRIIHIAGTNGKGSVLCFISSVLKTAGYRTGRFFSPSISKYHERFQINNRMISKDDFAFYLAVIKEAADGMVAQGLMHPTAFEIDTALAFYYFADKKCDLVVLETGLGGTSDATNVIKKPLLSVITPISLDHADILGKTYQEIAGHKAGIIKAGVNAISAAQRDDVMAVIKRRCSECESRLMVSPLYEIKLNKQKKPDYQAKVFPQIFSYGNGGGFRINMAGDHQVDNAVLALDAVTVLKEQGLKISEAAVKKGLRDAFWQGRFEMIHDKPPFIIDGAHNVDAAVKLAKTLKNYFTNKRIIYIMGVLSDKDYVSIIAETYAMAEHIITVTPPNPRALNGYDLAMAVNKFHPQATCADSIREACELAFLLAGKDGVIVAFGSLSILDEIKKGLLLTAERK